MIKDQVKPKTQPPTRPNQLLKQEQITLMKSMLRQFPKLCLATSLTLVLAAAPASADIPDNLTDIPYQSHDWGSQQLRHRGYALVSSDHQNGKKWEYWWNHNAKTCIKARADHGKYEALTVTGRTDCNQYHKDDDDNSNAAAVAIGAAAIIGAIALAHKSHERDEKHSQDKQSVSEFDRGYRDGLYHQSYHNYNRTEAYSDGYNAGQQKRDRETSYRSNEGHHSGYHPYEYVDDLVGVNAASADSTLRTRGFTDTGGFKGDGTSHVYWYNSRTRQCIETITQDGKIWKKFNLSEHRCDR